MSDVPPELQLEFISWHTKGFEAGQLQNYCTPPQPFNDQYHLLLYIWLVYLPVLYTGNYNHLNIRIIPSTDTHSYMYLIPPEFSNFIINIISINKCTVIYTKVYRLETTEWFWTFHIDKVHECIYPHHCLMKFH